MEIETSDNLRPKLLNDSQMEIFLLAARGWSSQAIADEQHCVVQHVRNVLSEVIATYQTFGSSIEAILEAIKDGTIPLTEELCGSPDIDDLAKLSEMEIKAFELVGQGYLYKEIASSLNLAHSTIKNGMMSVRSKLGSSNRTQLAITSLVFFHPESIYQVEDDYAHPLGD